MFLLFKKYFYLKKFLVKCVLFRNILCGWKLQMCTLKVDIGIQLLNCLLFSYIYLQEQYWFCYKIVLEVLKKLVALDLERQPHTWHSRWHGASSERARQVVLKEGLCCVHNVLSRCIIWFPFQQLPEGSIVWFGVDSVYPLILLR